MSIPPEIQTLANRLNQAIDEIDREATQGANLRRFGKFIGQGVGS
jgi:hypothetical protein